MGLHWQMEILICTCYVAGYAYRREGQTMDQVLFSEPSTKMKQRMEAIKQESAKESSQLPIEEKGATTTELNEVDRFLNDKFK